MIVFKEGDVVYMDGASGMLGDVSHVEEPDDQQIQEVTVVWRKTETTEWVDVEDSEMVLADDQTPPKGP